MAGSKVKKLNLIVSRADIYPLLGELIGLQCVELHKPSTMFDYAEFPTPLTHEILKLDTFEIDGVPEDSIELLGTQYTLLLTAWIESKQEPELKAALDRYTCAWEIKEPEDEELEEVPLLHQGLVNKIRGRTARILQPMMLHRDLTSTLWEHESESDDSDDYEESEEQQ